MLVDERVKYSSHSLIRTPFCQEILSFGDREHHMHSQYLLPNIGALSRGVCSLGTQCPIREGPLYIKTMWLINREL